MNYEMESYYFIIDIYKILSINLSLFIVSIIFLFHDWINIRGARKWI